MKTINISASGIIQITQYGMYIDGADVLEAISAETGANRFAGALSITIDDDTSPLVIDTEGGRDDL